MQKLIRGSGELVLRHELDGLASSHAIAADLATPEQLGDLAAIARKEIPGVQTSDAGLRQFWQRDPESIFVFRKGDTILGGIAFLYLNYRGLDALLLDEIALSNPTYDQLAQPGQEVAAIYVWALAAHGRGAMAIGTVAEALRQPRFRDADYYAQPSSREGRGLLAALGFAPIPSFQADLWCYQRPWNRDPSVKSYSHVSAQSPSRSFADARR